MKIGLGQRLRLLIIAALLCVILMSGAWFIMSDAARPRGHLLIVGGGDMPSAILDRFVELAGGPVQARIAIFPMASRSREGYHEAAEIMASLAMRGVAAELIVLDRDQAADAEIAGRLATFSGFWFGGGDQSRLTATLLGTLALERISQRYHGGAVIGGTSAGAAAMSHNMLTGNRLSRDEEAALRDGVPLPAIARGAFEIAPGFGFLPDTIVDQHFLQRSRHNRLLSAVLEYPHLLGVGIDEGTAVLVRPDSRWEVLGDSYVKVFDARKARFMAGDGPVVGTSNITLHLLPSRSVFNPRNGRTTLPEV